MPKQILLIDDDALMRRSLAYDLDRAGYRVATADCAEQGLRLAAQLPPDLVLLDIGLPGMDGLEAFRHFRARCPAPIIFLTARRRPFDEVAGLELGAHDYVTKPFNTDVLIARINGVLARATADSARAGASQLAVGDLRIDPAGQTVTRAGQPLSLTPREFSILYTLAAQPGQLVSLDHLLAHVWGLERAVEPQVIYVHMRGLREKLEEDARHPRRLITVHGMGYKLVPQGA